MAVIKSAIKMKKCLRQAEASAQVSVKHAMYRMFIDHAYVALTKIWHGLFIMLKCLWAPNLNFDYGDTYVMRNSQVLVSIRSLFLMSLWKLTRSLHLTWEFSDDTSKDYIQYYKLSAIIKETKCTHFVVISVAYVFCKV